MELDVHHSSRQGLARVLDLTSGLGPVWAERDFAAILRHQIAAPVDGVAEPAQDTTAAPPAPAPVTFADLLDDPHPSRAALDAAKRFCKAALQPAEGSLPPDVARLLYYAVIAAGLLHGGVRITQLSDADLRVGVAWALEQPWLDSRLGALFQAWLAQATPA